MNLYLVQDTGDDDNLDRGATDLLVIAADPMDAFKRWLAHYSEWDKPRSVRVWTLPTPDDMPAGPVDWDALHRLDKGRAYGKDFYDAD